MWRCAIKSRELFILDQIISKTMNEFDCKTLREICSSEKPNIHVKFENDIYLITWEKRKEPSNINPHTFQFPSLFLNQILNKFFVEDRWYLLGADRSNRPMTGLGKFIVENQNYFPKSPQYASAIAGIMYTLNLIEYRQMPKRGKPILLKKK